MPRLSTAVPKYRKHRASGQAVVTLHGVDHYLGPHDSKASKAEYDRLICRYLAENRQPTVLAGAQHISIAEVLAAFLQYAKGYYVKNGSTTKEYAAFRLIVADVYRFYKDDPAQKFGPSALKAVREVWKTRGQSRPTLNKNMGRLIRIFKWAASEELLEPSVYQALATVPGLKKGRCDAPEPDPILPVSMQTVQQTLPHLTLVPSAMVKIQLLTGMRPGEICILCPDDILRTNTIWEYRPKSHKTEHRDRSRIVFIGPKAQSILRPFLLRNGSKYCFSPRENMQQFLEDKTVRRVTPLSCGNRTGTNRKAKPAKQPGDCYDANSYRRAVHRACDKAFPLPDEFAKAPGETQTEWKSRLGADKFSQAKEIQSKNRWSPNQLRHTFATRVRREYDLNAAQVLLGHASVEVTQVYAERDFRRAREVIEKAG